jgi:plastocyanin
MNVRLQFGALTGLAIFALAGLVTTAMAQDATVRLSIKDHRFQPSEVRVPAGKPVTIEVRNLDTTPAEFESKTLRVEKVIAGGASVIIKVRALSAGRYRFFDDYHEDTTEGYLVVE